jgi:hypothetical protein
VKDGKLTSIMENTGIIKDLSTGTITNGNGDVLHDTDIVSMNFWMFHHKQLQLLQEEFDKRYEDNKNNLSAEFPLPSYCNTLIHV